MILAAGLGTRLRPLTDDRPKALVEVAGRTLLEITIARLREFGVREVIVNVHHFAGMIAEYLRAKNRIMMVHWASHRRMAARPSLRSRRRATARKMRTANAPPMAASRPASINCAT